jgi:hypothetical protein
MIMTGKPKYSGGGGNYSIVTLTTTNPTWTGLRSNSLASVVDNSNESKLYINMFVPYREHGVSPLQRPIGDCYIGKEPLLNMDNTGSQSSLVGIVTRLRAGRSGVRIPVEARDFSLLQNVQTGSGAHPASYSVGIVVPSRG